MIPICYMNNMQPQFCNLRNFCINEEVNTISWTRSTTRLYTICLLTNFKSQHHDDTAHCCSLWCISNTIIISLTFYPCILHMNRLATDRFINLSFPFKPMPFAHKAIRRFRLLCDRPTATIFSCIFSQTLGTPRNAVGRTSFIVSPSEP